MGITPEEFERISRFIHEHSGIVIGKGKEYLVENRLTTLLIQNGCENFVQLCDKLKTDTGPLRAKVVDAMTTNETLWFRDDSFFHALSDSIVPWLIERANRKTVRVWSAACSTGQEPYSVAMLITDQLRQTARGAPDKSRFKIVATDLSPTALMMARMARYSQLAISRGMKKPFLDTYFTKKGMAYEVDPEVRALVEFKPYNLKESFTSLGSFDFVLCRNVLIYFDDQMKSQIYGKIHGVLESDGLLAIGASESPRGYTDRFEQVLMGNAVMFRPKDAGGKFTVQFPTNNNVSTRQVGGGLR